MPWISESYLFIHSYWTLLKIIIISKKEYSILSSTKQTFNLLIGKSSYLHLLVQDLTIQLNL